MVNNAQRFAGGVLATSLNGFDPVGAIGAVSQISPAPCATLLLTEPHVMPNPGPLAVKDTATTWVVPVANLCHFGQWYGPSGSAMSITIPAQASAYQLAIFMYDQNGSIRTQNVQLFDVTSNLAITPATQIDDSTDIGGFAFGNNGLWAVWQVSGTGEVRLDMTVVSGANSAFAGAFVTLGSAVPPPGPGLIGNE